MSLELAFKRLSLGTSPICRQCRRTLASTPNPRQQQSATAAFAESLTSSNSQTAREAPSQESGRPGRTTSEPDRLVPRSSYEMSMVQDIAEAKQRREAKERAADVERRISRADLEKQQIRRWRVGDVYAPHDLTGVEQAKWKKLRRKGKQKRDVVDQLGINPIHHYKNFSIMSEYMSDMGRIKHSTETGLRPVNQRRMAKAVRRAIGTGLMPGVHRHPEILKSEMNARRQQI